MKQVNFIFIRHGESCQQVAHDNVKTNWQVYYHKFTDPTLSDTGVQDSVKTGSYLQNTLKKHSIDSIDIIGSSSMLRAIETAYYSTNGDPEIFVFPYLRECKECGSDTTESLDQIWPIKSIEEQKSYLEKENIKNVNYTFVENDALRKSPGNIVEFIKWFYLNILNTETEGTENGPLNVLIFTHSGVIRHFTGISPSNNSGFILETANDGKDKIKLVGKKVFLNMKISRGELECPSNKCPGVCDQNVYEEINHLAEIMNESPLTLALRYRVTELPLLTKLIESGGKVTSNDIIIAKKTKNKKVIDLLHSLTDTFSS